MFSFGGAQFYGSTGSCSSAAHRRHCRDAGSAWLLARCFGRRSLCLRGCLLLRLGTGTWHRTRWNGVVLPSLDCTDHWDHVVTRGRGYLLVGADGGVFAFGDATFSGSCYQTPCGSNTAVAAAVPDKSGNGYWFLMTNGLSYNFGDAPPSCFVPPQTVAVTSASGPGNSVTYDYLFANGYFLDCGNVNFGSALGQLAPGDRATAIVLDDNDDYWIATARGAVFAFGVGSYGSMAGKHLNAPIVGAAGW